MAKRQRKTNSVVAVETQQMGWRQLHSKIVTDDTIVVAVTTQNFANKDIGEDSVEVPHNLNGIIITFLGIATNQTVAFKWKLYGYRWPHGPGQLIANGTGNLGDVAVVTHPVTGTAVTAYYADELTITTHKWPKTVAVYDVGGASGEIATIVFDGLGISHLRCELTDCTAGTANETDELEAVFTGG